MRVYVCVREREQESESQRASASIIYHANVVLVYSLIGMNMQASVRHDAMMRMPIRTRIPASH